jgi:hypothetical protein
MTKTIVDRQHIIKKKKLKRTQGLLQWYVRIFARDIFGFIELVRDMYAFYSICCKV